MSESVSVTYRWRRRQVVPTRVTWVGLVTVFLMLIHKYLMKAFPDIGMSGKAVWFIGVVIIPVLLLILWRAGLLPPERVAVTAEPAPAAPDAE